jgi:hypothetical protein
MIAAIGIADSTWSSKADVCAIVGGVAAAAINQHHVQHHEVPARLHVAFGHPSIQLCP